MWGCQTEQLERQVGVGVPRQASGPIPRRALLSFCLPSFVGPCVLPAPRSQCGPRAPAEPSHFLYHLSLQAPENYFYVPDLGQVPEIDVPSYLPDLPGVADDLMYSADLGPGIAPSAPGAIPELPAFHTEVAEPLQPGKPGSRGWN